MLILILYFIITGLIAILIISIPLFIRTLTKKWIEKESSFECGIRLRSSARKPFSVRFFLLIILFIIFDVEIAMIIIIPVLILKISISTITFILAFIIVLFKGLIYE